MLQLLKLYIPLFIGNTPSLKALSYLLITKKILPTVLPIIRLIVGPLDLLALL